MISCLDPLDLRAQNLQMKTTALCTSQRYVTDNFLCFSQHTHSVITIVSATFIMNCLTSYQLLQKTKEADSTHLCALEGL